MNFSTRIDIYRSWIEEQIDTAPVSTANSGAKSGAQEMEPADIPLEHDGDIVAVGCAVGNTNGTPRAMALLGVLLLLICSRRRS